MSDNPYRPPTAASEPPPRAAPVSDAELAKRSAAVALPWVRLATILSLASALIGVARALKPFDLPEAVRAGYLRGLLGGLVLAAVFTLLLGNYARALARVAKEPSVHALERAAVAHQVVFRGYGWASIVGFVLAIIGSMLLLTRL